MIAIDPNHLVLVIGGARAPKKSAKMSAERKAYLNYFDPDGKSAWSYDGNGRVPMR